MDYSTNTASLCYRPLALLSSIYKHCLTGSSTSDPIIAYLKTLPHRVILLYPYYSLSTNTASLNHPPLTLLLPIYKYSLTGSSPLDLNLAYSSNLFYKAPLVHPPLALLWPIDKHCLTWLPSSRPLSCILQT